MDPEVESRRVLRETARLARGPEAIRERAARAGASTTSSHA